MSDSTVTKTIVAMITVRIITFQTQSTKTIVAMITVCTITDLTIVATVATILQIRSSAMSLLPVIDNYDVSSFEWLTVA